MSTPAWLDRLLDTPCTVHNRVPGGTDEYGNETYAEVSTDAMCRLSPAAQEEIQDGRAQVGQYVLHLPASMVGLLDGFARVEVDGASYEVAAPPAFHRSLTAPGYHHVEVVVSRGSA
jgi:hypothetical protein